MNSRFILNLSFFLQTSTQKNTKKAEIGIDSPNNLKLSGFKVKIDETKYT